MSDSPHNPFREPQSPLDKLVRAQLDNEARDTNAAAMLAAVQARLAADAPSPAPAAKQTLRRRLLVIGQLAIAASILIAAFFLMPAKDVMASPEQVIGKAREVHAQELDRCYRVHAELAPEIQRRLPFLVPQRDVTIWTRGDRFVIEPGSNGKGTWGRDEQGRVWIAPSPEAGVRFEADEVPEPMAEFLAVRSVRWLALLDTVLADCDLTRLPVTPEMPKGYDRIEAKPRPGKAVFLKSAEIIVHPETHDIQSLVLRRKLLREDLATITFSSAAATQQPESWYRIEHHLKNAEAPVYDRARPLLRQKLLLQHYVAGLLGKNL